METSQRKGAEGHREPVFGKRTCMAGHAAIFIALVAGVIRILYTDDIPLYA